MVVVLSDLVLLFVSSMGAWNFWSSNGISTLWEQINCYTNCKFQVFSLFQCILACYFFFGGSVKKYSMEFTLYMW